MSGRGLVAGRYSVRTWRAAALAAAVAAGAGAPGPAAAQEVEPAGAGAVGELDGVVVYGTSPLAEAGEASHAVQQIAGEDLARAPRQTLDASLRSTPGFRLFRRSGSDSAHPTTQGVSLRNTGANAAGRTLVTLDGIPQNDPFGGWVPWVKLAPALVGDVRLIRDGGVTPDGRGTMGGAVDVTSWLPMASRSAAVHLRAGEALAYDALAAGAYRGNSGRTTVAAGFRSVDFQGYPVVAAGQRGAVDTDAGHRLDWATAALHHEFDDAWSVGAKVELWSERRSNGTPLAGNETRAIDGGVTLVRQAPGGESSTEIALFGQGREFDNTFTAVTPDRGSERVVLDQFDVPSESAGGSVRHRRSHGRHQFVAGVDSRWVRGFTNEDFRNLGAGFTRRRRAGGEQWQSGVFVVDTIDLGQGVELTAAGRLDHRRRFGAGRRESDLTTGATLLDEQVPDSSTFSGSGRLGLSWEVAAGWSVRSSLFTGTREPTLNELYRPFRVGNDITEPNPLLADERASGADLGFRWEPDDSVAVAGSVFYNRLDDLVANVTLAEGPGFVPPWGFIPAGGTGRQRQNIDTARVAGLEVAADWRPVNRWRFTGSYLLTGTEITRASHPDLAGKSLPQVPDHQLSAGVEFSPNRRSWIAAELRYLSSQFEDDLNDVSLGSAVTVDLFAGFRLTEHWELTASLENVFDETVETRKTADGLTYVGAPRLWTLGLRAEF